MLGKLQTALWFANRPTTWAHAGDLAARKFRSDHDGPEHVREATAWAAARAVSVADALAATGFDGAPVPTMPVDLLAEGYELARRSAVQMGGAGDVNLLHAVVKLSGARRIVETGVAYGWSSLAILSALDGYEDAKVASVDMPYPKMNNEAFVGVVVPDRFRKNWQIVREPDRNGLKKAIALLGGEVDLCHYDSDKSWWGRRYGFGLLWDALRNDGVFVSDDIQDNMAFAEFVADKRVPFAVTAFEGKYVGIARKAR